MRKTLFLIITCFLLGCAPSKPKDLTTIPEPKYRWKEVNVDWVYSLAIHPANSNKIYLATEHGVYKSEDKANTWKASNYRLYNINLSTVVVDPKRPEIIFLGGDGGVFKSINGGGEWQEKNIGLTNPLVKVLAIDQNDTNKLYAGCFGSGGLFITRNGGDSWEGVKEPLSDVQITSIALDKKIYIGTWGKGVYKSEDNGLSFQPVNAGLTNLNIRAITIPTTGTETVYVATEDGVFFSSTGGNTWLPRNKGLLNHNVWTLLIDNKQPEIIYAGTWIGGIYKSENSGNQWKEINVGLVNTCVHTLMGDPAEANIIYAGTEGGIFQSIDGGTHWKAKNKGLVYLVKEIVPLPIPKELLKKRYKPEAKPKEGAHGEGH